MMSTSAAPATEAYLTQAGGLRIFFRSWRPSTPPVGVVVICHGVNSHSGQYVWAATEMAARGYAVYALDLRGRGQSDGERFFVEDIAEYVDDLALLMQTVRKRESGLPVFLLGHSAGGVVSATYVLERQAELAGFICESFAFQVYAPDFALAVLKGLSHVAPHLHVLRLKNEDFSRDPGIVASMNSDPLIDNEVQPTSTVAALVRADERLRIEFPLITLPLLIMHGDADRATKPAGSTFFFESAGSADKILKLYPGHFHDLLNDIGREAVVADMLAWMDARLP